MEESLLPPKPKEIQESFAKAPASCLAATWGGVPSALVAHQHVDREGGSGKLSKPRVSLQASGPVMQLWVPLTLLGLDFLSPGSWQPKGNKCNQPLPDWGEVPRPGRLPFQRLPRKSCHCDPNPPILVSLTLLSRDTWENLCPDQWSSPL